MRVLILGIGVVVLWNHPEARVNTANFLRSIADLLSHIERPIKYKHRQS